MTHVLVGYGTLLDAASTGMTIGASAEHKVYRPVVVRGYRRLFNLRPDHYTPSHKTGSAAEEAAAMNVEPAPGLAFNGVAFDVSGEEMRQLDERERYYERVSVEILDFASGSSLGRAQVFSAELEARWICRDPEVLLPLWRDIDLARAGAYRLGDAFGEMFDQTTYLADGETLMITRYREYIDEGEPEIALARNSGEPS